MEERDRRGCVERKRERVMFCDKALNERRPEVKEVKERMMSERILKW